MLILGIDTSSHVNAIGVVDGDRVLAEYAFEAKTDSLEKIITNIDYALKSTSLSLDDVQGFGVGLGPGSWTGIRIGVTVGKVLAYCTNKPVFGIPTLEALAFSAGNVSETICAVIGAGAGDTVYAAFYRMENRGVKRVGDYYVGNMQSLLETVREPVIFIGSGVNLNDKSIAKESNPHKIAVQTATGLPEGSAVALLAAKRCLCGDGDDALSLTPLYLKESTAKAFMGRYTRNAQIKGRGL